MDNIKLGLVVVQLLVRFVTALMEQEWFQQGYAQALKDQDKARKSFKSFVDAIAADNPPDLDRDIERLRTLGRDNGTE